MFLNLFIVVVLLAIVVGCLVSVIMSTSHGASWLQSLWEREEAPRDADGHPPD